jgi:sulfur carrier protein
LRRAVVEDSIAADADIVVVRDKTIPTESSCCFMTIRVNGELQHLENASLSLVELLSVAKVESPELVTVQINGEFVDRASFPSTQIHENDEVDFLYFLGGGRGE